MMRRRPGAFLTRWNGRRHQFDQTLTSLTRQPGVDVFPFDVAMLERTTVFALEKLDLHPFDQAVLAAVLVRTEALRFDGETEFGFCELDSDLQPWDEHGKRKEP